MCDVGRLIEALGILLANDGDPTKQAHTWRLGVSNAPRVGVYGDTTTLKAFGSCGPYAIIGASSVKRKKVEWAYGAPRYIRYLFNRFFMLWLHDKKIKGHG